MSYYLEAPQIMIQYIVTFAELKIHHILVSLSVILTYREDTTGIIKGILLLSTWTAHPRLLRGIYRSTQQQWTTHSFIIMHTSALYLMQGLGESYCKSKNIHTLQLNFLFSDDWFFSKYTECIENVHCTKRTAPRQRMVFLIARVIITLTDPFFHWVKLIFFMFSGILKAILFKSK